MINRTIQLFGLTAFVIRIGFDDTAAKLSDEITLPDGNVIYVISGDLSYDGYTDFRTAISSDRQVGSISTHHDSWKEARIYHRATVTRIKSKMENSPELEELKGISDYHENHPRRR